MSYLRDSQTGVKENGIGGIQFFTPVLLNNERATKEPCASDGYFPFANFLQILNKICAWSNNFMIFFAMVVSCRKLASVLNHSTLKLRDFS